MFMEMLLSNSCAENTNPAPDNVCCAIPTSSQPFPSPGMNTHNSKLLLTTVTGKHRAVPIVSLLGVAATTTAVVSMQTCIQLVGYRINPNFRCSKISGIFPN